MTLEECQARLEHAEREWGKLRDLLEEKDSQLSWLSTLEQELQACAKERDKLKEDQTSLRAKVRVLEGFKRKVEHPSFWIEDVAYPLAERLRECEKVVLPKNGLAKPVEANLLARSWAERLPSLVQENPGPKERREIEALLIALWHWLRMQEVRSLFEE